MGKCEGSEVQQPGALWGYAALTSRYVPRAYARVWGANGTLQRRHQLQSNYQAAVLGRLVVPVRPLGIAHRPFSSTESQGKMTPILTKLANLKPRQRHSASIVAVESMPTTKFPEVGEAPDRPTKLRGLPGWSRWSCRGEKLRSMSRLPCGASRPPWAGLGVGR